MPSCPPNYEWALLQHISLFLQTLALFCFVIFTGLKFFLRFKIMVDTQYYDNMRANKQINGVLNIVVVVLRSRESIRHDHRIQRGPSNQFSWFIVFSRFLPKSRLGPRERNTNYYGRRMIAAS